MQRPWNSLSVLSPIRPWPKPKRFCSIDKKEAHLACWFEHGPWSEQNKTLQRYLFHLCTETDSNCTNNLKDPPLYPHYKLYGTFWQLPSRTWVVIKWNLNIVKCFLKGNLSILIKYVSNLYLYSIILLYQQAILILFKDVKSHWEDIFLKSVKLLTGSCPPNSI